jgi:hypothetical protein
MGAWLLVGGGGSSKGTSMTCEGCVLGPFMSVGESNGVGCSMAVKGEACWLVAVEASPGMDTGASLHGETAAGLGGGCSKALGTGVVSGNT